VSVWIATCAPDASATRRQVSIAAGVAPQSSWILNPAAPARSCSHRASSWVVLPLPSRAKFTGHGSRASNIRARCQAPGVTVVALVPSAGPVPPPIRVVTPEPSASWIDCGQIRCTCPSIPPAVRILPLPEITSVDGPITSAGCTPSMVSGFPALPSATIRPSRIPTSAFTTPQWSSTTAPVMTVSGVPGRPSRATRVAWPMPIDSRITFPPPNTASSPPAQWSRSTSMNRSVSASRIRSPAVGP